MSPSAMPRRSGNTELYAWFFMRVSGIVLLFLAVIHLVWMHVVIRVDNIDFNLVAARWQNPFWRLYDLLLLVFAMTHGTNGARTVIDDYIPRGMANTAAKWALYVVAAVFILMGAHVLFTFRLEAHQ